MEILFGVIIILVFLIAVFRPLLGRLLGPLITRWIARKQEDLVRRMMGMPTRKEEKRRRKQREKQGRKAASRWGRRPAGAATASAGHKDAAHGNDAVAFMRTVAEDVEYTEIHITSDSTPK